MMSEVATMEDFYSTFIAGQTPTVPANNLIESRY